MTMTFKASITLFALVACASTTLAADDKPDFLDGPILSCADVKCPSGPNNSGVDCRITNNTYHVVGVSEIPNTSDALDGLTWVQAGAVRDTDRRHFIKDFYLGTDPQLDISTTGACALFFTNVSSIVEFKRAGVPKDVSQGTCAEAMSEQCVDRMLERARAASVQGISTAAACEKLKTAFVEDLDDECASFATGAAWEGIEAKVLSGPGAPQPITPQQNASSNCWPILPKSHDLTPVMNMDTTGDGYVSTGLKHLFPVTPILTVFFPTGNTTGSSVSRSEAHLTCMKLVDLNENSLANMSPGVPESSASQRGASLVVALIAALLTSMI